MKLLKSHHFHLFPKREPLKGRTISPGKVYNLQMPKVRKTKVEKLKTKERKNQLKVLCSFCLHVTSKTFFMYVLDSEINEDIHNIHAFL